MNFSYSVAIRTLGTAGEKYKKLLDSIQEQTIQPEKIVVVLPEGYKLPEYQLGNEEFVFSAKGMMPQRIEALKYITSEYTLFCDDDVEFEELFTKKILNTLRMGEFDCASGPLLDFFPPATPKYAIASVLGGACVMLHGRKNNYVRILNTGGWSYNWSIDLQHHKIYDTDSLPGTCFMVRTEAMKKIHLGKELWAEKTGYSAFEDRIMIGKLAINGYKSCVISDAMYHHNDGKTSTNNLKLEPVYAGAYNHYVFWHRYIYSPERSFVKRYWMKICISYYVAMSKFYNKIKYRHSDEVYKTVCKGFADAKIFVKSKEYMALESAMITH
jgi:hypothetical protein